MVSIERRSTGAYNRRFYEEKIKHQTTPAAVNLLTLDVDDFKDL